jgi:hypothetical protein
MKDAYLALAKDLKPFAGDVRYRAIRVIRSYAMFDRREAPQIYPEVQRSSS